MKYIIGLLGIIQILFWYANEDKLWLLIMGIGLVIFFRLDTIEEKIDKNEKH